MMMNQEETQQLAQEMGFDNWIDEDSRNNRGWYICEMTGRKFRGANAERMIELQKKAMAERQAEIEKGEDEMEDITIRIGDDAQLTDDENMIEAKEEGDSEVDGEEFISNIDQEGHEISEKLRAHIIKNGASKVVVIECEGLDDEKCDIKRVIKVQDAFQVTRCTSCQKKYRNRKRTERRRQKRQEEKQTNADN